MHKIDSVSWNVYNPSRSQLSSFIFSITMKDQTNSDEDASRCRDKSRKTYAEMEKIRLLALDAITGMIFTGCKSILNLHTGQNLCRICFSAVNSTLTFNTLSQLGHTPVNL